MSQINNINKTDYFRKTMSTIYENIMIKHLEIIQEITEKLDLSLYKLENLSGNFQSQKMKQTEIEPKYTNIKVPLPQPKQDQLSTREILVWIGLVVKEVFSATFNKFYHHQLNQAEAKCYASENFLFNFMKLTQKIKLTEQQFKDIEKNLKKNILPYIKAKYPQKAEPKVSLSFKKKIEQIDKYQNNENDLFFKSGITFELSKEREYDEEIMKFLNYVIRLPEMKFKDIDKRKVKQVEKKNLSQDENALLQMKLQEKFEEDFQQLFEKIYSEEKVMKMKRKEKCDEQIVLDEKYADKVDEYTKYYISRKLPVDLEMFSEQEIDNGDWKFKKSSLMRVVTKWCDELRHNFKKPEEIAHKHGQFRMKDGSERYLSLGEAETLELLLRRKEEEIQKWLEEVRQDNLHHWQKFSHARVMDDIQLAMLSKEESMVGIFSTINRKNYEFYLVHYLKQLIHHCLTVMDQFEALCYCCNCPDQWNDILEENVDEKVKEGKKQRRIQKKNKEKHDEEEEEQANIGKDSQVINLITFKVGDLLRCKCTSKQKEISALFSEIQRISAEEPEKLKIVRVKNRLDRGTADVLINLMFHEKLLVEVQLAIDNGKSRFIDCSDSFNHYIYEIERAELGPISEFCNIWTNKNSRANFFLKIFKKKHQFKYPTRQKKNLMEEKSTSSSSRRRKQMKFPFECEAEISNNEKCSHYGVNTLDIPQDDIHMNLCNQCSLKGKSYEELRKILKNLPQAQGQEIQRVTYESLSKPEEFPEIGIMINLADNKQETKYFKCVKRYKRKFLIIERDKKIENVAEVTTDEQQKKFFETSLILVSPNFSEMVKSIQSQKVVKSYFIPKLFQQIYQKKKQSLRFMREGLDDKDLDSSQVINSIKKINLSQNRLKNFTKIVEKFPRSEILILNDNEFENIDINNTTLQRLEKLKRFCFNKNNLRFLPENFCKLMNLYSIEISTNSLFQLPKNFGDLSKLEQLNLSNNEIESLPLSFEKLKNLSRLNLTKNKLGKIPSSLKTLQHLSNLRILNISHNELEQLPEIFESFQNLSILDLKQNLLTFLPNSFCKLTHLSELNLSKNKLTSLNKSFGSLVNLSTPLDLSENNLTELPESIGDLIHLPKLDLSFNLIASLPDSIGNLADLQVINLRGNQLRSIPDSFCFLKKIRFLNLRSNQLEKLPSDFGNLVKVKYLYLHSNKLKNLPDSFSNLQRIKSLHLYSNKLEKLPSNFQCLTRLWKLLLQENQLTELPDCFDSFDKLETLNISSNKIRKIPASVGSLKRIKTLDIRSNRLLEPQKQSPFSNSQQFADDEIDKIVENNKKIMQNLKEEKPNLIILI